MPGSSFLGRVDRAVELFCEIGAGALVAVEIVILFAGVVARYAFNHPLVWVEELAAILFLWLVSLGAVIALRRTEHMRMTVLIGRAGPRWRRIAACFAALLVVVVTLGLLVPGLSYAQQQTAILTPVLQWPGSVEIYGQLVGLVLLLYVALRQLLGSVAWLELLGVLLFSAAVFVGLYYLQDWFDDIGNCSLIVFFIGIVGFCIFVGVPIAFSFAIATFGYLHFTSNIPLATIISQMDQGMSSIELLAVPMFVVLGLLLEMTGIARAMVEFLAALVGNRRGGLSYVLIGAMYLISGISGSKAADQAAVAPVLLPEMRRRGMAPGELAAQLAAAAAMSETIPPSLVLIIVGAVTGVSISALFTGGLLPAGIAAAGLCALIFVRSRRDAPSSERVTAATVLRLFVVAIPALILPFIIRWGRARRGHDRDGSGHARRGLRDPGRPFRLSQLRLASARDHPGGDGGAVGRHPAHHRQRQRDGVVADPSRVRADTDRPDDRAAGRAGGVHGDLDRSLCRARQRAGRICRPWCYSGRCCSRSPSISGSISCSMRSWRSWRWGSGYSRRRSGLGSTRPV